MLSSVLGTDVIAIVVVIVIYYYLDSSRSYPLLPWDVLYIPASMKSLRLHRFTHSIFQVAISSYALGLNGDRLNRLQGYLIMVQTPNQV